VFPPPFVCKAIAASIFLCKLRRALRPLLLPDLFVTSRREGSGNRLFFPFPPFDNGFPLQFPFLVVRLSHNFFFLQKGSAWRKLIWRRVARLVSFGIPMYIVLCFDGNFRFWGNARPPFLSHPSLPLNVFPFSHIFLLPCFSQSFSLPSSSFPISDRMPILPTADY